ncbi:hypothetical protein BLA60_01950 [Actinophytocola xinjiangensis]|uniref:tRNA nuclease CdiA C-terminal domain-containing protein n=1 Tax=Actinophytocola xinjiangensis TaxID=485602 RepID=A0A7Z0WRD5_9PSEU|nr:hypothetical protein [Actinophytocola xinjiangensis]OLF13965.1 hypothetical protein BLA60_01950 [Actinophytocola xinjiangensis]
MTVTLPPELADLLGRTGHRWPDGNEDHLLTMADGWRALGATLDSTRTSHRTSASAVLDHNNGPAVSAYGEWTRKYDDLLLRLVELCARVEALLLAIARSLLAAKKAILDALKNLARAIEQAKRGIRNVPVIGPGIAEILEEVIQPLVEAARTVIGEILEKLSALVVEVVVPRLTAFIEQVKTLIQDLRKLIKDESGADWPTPPSNDPNPENRPTGKPATWRSKDDPSTKRGRKLENEAAVTLAQAGYDVEQGPTVPGTKKPDYRIEGKIFDCASPTSPDAYSIWSNIKKKKVERGQADRMIINIDDPAAEVSVEELRRQFQQHPIAGLKEVKVIGRGGAVIDIYP